MRHVLLAGDAFRHPLIVGPRIGVLSEHDRHAASQTFLLPVTNSRLKTCAADSRAPIFRRKRLEVLYLVFHGFTSFFSIDVDSCRRDYYAALSLAVAFRPESLFNLASLVSKNARANFNRREHPARGHRLHSTLT